MLCEFAVLQSSTRYTPLPHVCWLPCKLATTSVPRTDSLFYMGCTIPHGWAVSQCDRLSYPIGYQDVPRWKKCVDDINMTTANTWYQNLSLVSLLWCLLPMCEIIMVLCDGKHVKRVIVLTLLFYSVIAYWILTYSLLQIKKWYSLSLSLSPHVFKLEKHLDFPLCVLLSSTFK